jgi:hypothetical protein
MNVELSAETADALDVARMLYPETCENDDELLFKILLEWMKYQGKESLDDWISDFFV